MNTYEEINDCVRLAQTGDVAALGTLIESISPLIKSKCKHYFGFVSEDNYQNGVLKSIELILSYDFERNTRFLGYMKYMLSCYFWDLKKEELKHLQREICKEQESEIAYEEDYSSLEVKEVLSVLNHKELEVITSCIIEGNTLVKTSKDLNISYNWTKQLKKSGLLKIKKIFT